MKRVINSKLMRWDGMVQWNMVRVVTIGGTEQMLAYMVSLSHAELKFSREMCAARLRLSRRSLRDHVTILTKCSATSVL